MPLTVYAQAADPQTIQLWVGIFGTENPPAPQFFIDRLPAAPLNATSMTPIRDQHVGPDGLPVNHHGIYRFATPEAGLRHLVQVIAGSERYEFGTSTLPKQVPQTLEGSFNVLLCSCYYQPEDSNGLLGTIVSQIQVQPDLTVLAGDQVYMDLPLLENLPEHDPALSQVLGDKYRRNWAYATFNVPSLEPVLKRAPVVTVPDDHEFWNNYPFPQKQLPNTWDSKVRGRWEAAAQALYEDYQLATDPAQAGATRLDVAPLRMLFVDMRCRRDNFFKQLMNARAKAALSTWVKDLLADKAAGRPAVGVLSSGQALFIDPPHDERKKRDVDAEMGNYDQFSIIQKALSDLADSGVAVVYLTGDVHWGRVACGEDQQNQNRPLLYEVISSPSRLIRVPFLDAAKESAKAVKGIFGKNDPWPRHSDSEDVPEFFGTNRRFKLDSKFKRRGDQVAMLTFTRAGTGVDFSVSYYGIHPDKSISKSETVGPYQLRAI